MTSGKYFDTIAELNSDPSVDMEGMDVDHKH